MVLNQQNGSSSMTARRRKISKSSFSVAEMLESVVGCKWSMRVLDALVAGTHRPGELKRACKGISDKVLNERLRKLTRFGIVDRVAYPEVPPRVVYVLTAFGQQFVPLVEAIRELETTLLESVDPEAR